MFVRFALLTSFSHGYRSDVFHQVFLYWIFDCEMEHILSYLVKSDEILKQVSVE
jgi:hypothetical protein